MRGVSVVIRCLADDRVFRCIESIDADVDIIVATSANKDFENCLIHKGIRYCLCPRDNLSSVSNIGIANAKNNNVIITDSDTIFKPNCINRMGQAMEVFKVVRAKLNFNYDSKRFGSRIVSEARDYVYSKDLAFTPGLGIRKDIAPEIGGFIFNEEVPFAVDADLDHRLKNNQVPVRYLEDAILIHDNESIRHDLKAAYRIGKGVMSSSFSLSGRPGYHLSPRRMTRLLKAVNINDYPRIIKIKGADVFLYQVIWDLFFHFGKNVRYFAGRKRKDSPTCNELPGGNDHGIDSSQ